MPINARNERSEEFDSHRRVTWLLLRNCALRGQKGGAAEPLRRAPKERPLHSAQENAPTLYRFYIGDSVLFRFMLI